MIIKKSHRAIKNSVVKLLFLREGLFIAFLNSWFLFPAFCYFFAATIERYKLLFSFNGNNKALAAFSAFIGNVIFHVICLSPPS